jgi:hypothetical protein
VSRSERSPKRACCMISELLEEAGLDRERVWTLRRQVLEGIILFCQWQLQRASEPKPAPGRPRARRVAVE